MRTRSSFYLSRTSIDDRGDRTMFENKRKLAGASSLVTTILVSIAFIVWSGPLVPEAIRALAPDNTGIAELGQGSDALARGRRGGGGRSFSAPRRSSGSVSRSRSSANKRSNTRSRSGSFRGSGGKSRATTSRRPQQGQQTRQSGRTVIQEPFLQDVVGDNVVRVYQILKRRDDQRIGLVGKR